MHTVAAFGSERVRRRLVWGDEMAFFTCDGADPSYLDLGRADRWGLAACRSVTDVFAAEGWDATPLLYPEAYPNAGFLPPQSAPAPGEERRPIHLSYRPTRSMNFVKGAYNIAACGWRYPTLPAHFTRRSLVQDNMAHMLGLAQEVWASSGYAAEAFREAGVENVHVMPAPVPALSPARDVRRVVDGYSVRFDGFNGDPATKLSLDEFLRGHAPKSGKQPTVFATMVDPQDPCANLEALLRGFRLATGNDPHTVLVVALAAGPQTRDDLRSEDIGYRLAEAAFHDDADLIADNILLVPDRLTAARFAGLMALTDYYLCASSAEDQNLPLQMGMAQGAIPVSTRVTAMADYLDGSNSIGVETESVAIEATGLPIGSTARSFPAEAPTMRSVAQAVRRALALTEAQREGLADAAKRTIEADYGIKAATRRIYERLMSLAEEESGLAERADGSISETPVAGKIGFMLEPAVADAS